MPSKEVFVNVERPIDHAGVEVLDKSECLALLAEQPIGRLGFVEDGEVTILPVRYVMHEGNVVFRSAVGAKLDAAVHWRAAAFEVDGWDQAQRSGWSVLVHGTVNEVTDPQREAKLNELGLELWVQGPRPTHWLEIRPHEITGRRIPD
jgi:uncharacterized protein